MVDDGDLMFKLFKSGFEKCNEKKYKINYQNKKLLIYLLLIEIQFINQF